MTAAWWLKRTQRNWEIINADLPQEILDNVGPAAHRPGDAGRATGNGRGENHVQRGLEHLCRVDAVGFRGSNRNTEEVGYEVRNQDQTHPSQRLCGVDESIH